jgi:hypothetical protein
MQTICFLIFKKHLSSLREEPQRILKSYYHLLGLDTRDEYGWTCEYSTVGRPPEKRIATIELSKYKRVDLLKKLLTYPNFQTQLMK